MSETELNCSVSGPVDLMLPDTRTFSILECYPDSLRWVFHRTDVFVVRSQVELLTFAQCPDHVLYPAVDFSENFLLAGRYHHSRAGEVMENRVTICDSVLTYHVTISDSDGSFNRPHLFYAVVPVEHYRDSIVFDIVAPLE